MALEVFLWSVALAIALFLVLQRWTGKATSSPLPPGPRPLPVIGNALDIPSTNMAAVFRDMSAKYGESEPTPGFQYVV